MANMVRNLAGQRFGILTALAPYRHPSRYTPGKRLHWLCACDCGAFVVRQGAALQLTHTTRTNGGSCGCLWGHWNVTHGRTHDRKDGPSFSMWRSMKSRCNNPKDKAYPRYGGAGVTLCEGWSDFQSFLDDMLPTYFKGATLDRRDGAKGYTPENCRWVDMQTQQNNRKDNVWLDTPKGRMTLPNAARAYGLKPGTLHARLKRYGASLVAALSAPVSKGQRFTTSQTVAPGTVSWSGGKTGKR